MYKKLLLTLLTLALLLTSCSQSEVAPTATETALPTEVALEPNCHCRTDPNGGATRRNRQRHLKKLPAPSMYLRERR